MSNKLQTNNSQTTGNNVASLRTDICIQIGNTDNKLTQQEWSRFIEEVKTICHDFGNFQFSGGSNTDDPWQNYCIVLSNVLDVDVLKDGITKIRDNFNQESVAILEGATHYLVNNHL